MGLHLIIDYYQDSRTARAEEFYFCMRNNLAHPEVEFLWNLGADEGFLPEDIRRHQKYRFQPGQERLTFRRAVDFANSQLNDKLVGIINLDICLESGHSSWAEAERLVRNSMLVLCQSRWELQPDRTLARDPGYARIAFANTQDGWFFVPPLTIADIDFELGTLGCDNAFAHRLHVAGKVPVNMGSRYRLMHVDRSRGKHAGNANSVHQSEHLQRHSTYSSFPERQGCYLVPDFDLVSDLHTLVDALQLSPLDEYRLKCDVLSRHITIRN